MYEPFQQIGTTDSRGAAFSEPFPRGVDFMCAEPFFSLSPPNSIHQLPTRSLGCPISYSILLILN